MKFCRSISITMMMQKRWLQKIELVIKNKITEKKDILATKEDVARIEGLFERRFNSLIMWLVGTALVTVGLIFTVLKLFVIK